MGKVWWSRLLVSCLVFQLHVFSMSMEQQTVPPDLAPYKEKIECWCVKLKRFCVEQDVVSIQTGLTEIKRIFELSEEMYYEWLDALESGCDTTLVDRVQSETRKIYLDNVKSAKKVLKDSGIPTVLTGPEPIESDAAASASVNSIGSELANALTLPKVSVPHFRETRWSTLLSLDFSMRSLRVKLIVIGLNPLTCPHF